MNDQLLLLMCCIVLISLIMLIGLWLFPGEKDMSSTDSMQAERIDDFLKDLKKLEKEHKIAISVDNEGAWLMDISDSESRSNWGDHLADLETYIER